MVERFGIPAKDRATRAVLRYDVLRREVAEATRLSGLFHLSEERQEIVEEIDGRRHLCHSIAVTLFRLTRQAGESIFDHLVYAAKKACLSGELQPGQEFTSVGLIAGACKLQPKPA